MRTAWIGPLLAAGLAAGAAAAQDIPIATVGPMTGPYAAYGQQMRAGAEMAVGDINARGGVNGRKLRLIVEDDACDARQAVAVAGKLAGLGVKLVAGHFCSGSSIPAARVYAAGGIVQISPASTSPKLTDERAGPNVFRICGRDDLQGEVAGRFLASRFKGGKVAIVHDRTTYGRGLADETRRHMSAAGLKEVLYEGYVAGDKDYSALVAKLKAIAVDVVYIGGYHTEAALIVRRMRNQGLQAPVVAGDTLVTLEYWQLTGKAGEGTLFTFSPDPRRSPAAADVARRFRDSKIEPEGYVLYAYAAIETWARAATAAGSEDAKAVTARLQADEFSTVLGAFRFDRKGDPSLPPYKLYQWKDGKYEQID